MMAASFGPRAVALTVWWQFDYTWWRAELRDRAYRLRYLYRDPPNACEECEKLGPVHAHHTDYQEPLKINYLCKACHFATHQRRSR